VPEQALGDIIIIPAHPLLKIAGKETGAPVAAICNLVIIDFAVVGMEETKVHMNKVKPIRLYEV
jgi:hypothetical protein